jgi:hypothetical protein
VRAGDVEGRELRYRLRESPEAGGPEAELDGRLRCFLRDRTLYVFHGEARTPAGSAQMERLFGSIELLPPA